MEPGMQLWHNEQDLQLYCRMSAIEDVATSIPEAVCTILCPPIVSGDARGSQQRNIPLQKFKAKLDNLNDTGLSRHYPRLEAVRAAV